MRGFWKKTWERLITIKVFYKEDKKKVVISYRDNGPWLDKERIKKFNDIYKPLYTTKDVEWTGLGMRLFKITLDNYFAEINILDWNWFWLDIILDNKIKK